MTSAETVTTRPTGYTHPEVLVETDWVAAHLDDPTVRIVEADEDPLLYEAWATSPARSSWTGISMCRIPSAATSWTRRVRGADEPLRHRQRRRR